MEAGCYKERTPGEAEDSLGGWYYGDTSLSVCPLAGWAFLTEQIKNSGMLDYLYLLLETDVILHYSNWGLYHKEFYYFGLYHCLLDNVFFYLDYTLIFAFFKYFFFNLWACIQYFIQGVFNTSIGVEELLVDYISYFDVVDLFAATNNVIAAFGRIGLDIICLAVKPQTGILRKHDHPSCPKLFVATSNCTTKDQHCQPLRNADQQTADPLKVFAMAKTPTDRIRHG